MGNYVTCKNYTKKEPSGFRNFLSTHFLLTVKIYVAIGHLTLLQNFEQIKTNPCNIGAKS